MFNNINLISKKNQFEMALAIVPASDSGIRIVSNPSFTIPRYSSLSLMKIPFKSIGLN